MHFSDTFQVSVQTKERLRIFSLTSTMRLVLQRNPRFFEKNIKSLIQNVTCFSVLGTT